MLQFMFLFAGLFFTTGLSRAADCHIHIDFQKKYSDHIILYGYYGSMYAADTIYFNNEGKACVDKNLESGMYTIIMPDSSSFDFVYIHDSEISIKWNLYTGNTDVKGNIESEKFNAYYRESTPVLNEIQSIRRKQDLKNLTKEEYKELKQLLQLLNDSLDMLQKKFITEDNQLLLSKMLMIDQPVDMSHLQLDTTMSDSARWMNSLKYYRDHFLDHIDFTDERLIRTPMLESKLEEYFDRIVPQNYKDIIDAIEKVIQLSSVNSEMHKYVTDYLFMKYTAKRNRVKYEEVFLYLFDNYAKEISPDIVSTEYLNQLQSDAQAIRSTLPGATAPNLILFDPEKKIQSLSDIHSELIVLFFYRTDCQICDRIIYRLKKILSVYSYLDITTVAINTGNDYEQWLHFIKVKNTGNWINLSCLNEPDRLKAYRLDLVPVIYLIDKDKTILGKQLTTSELEKLLLQIAIK